jgi:hypothetical protein
MSRVLNPGAKQCSIPEDAAMSAATQDELSKHQHRRKEEMTWVIHV